MAVVTEDYQRLVLDDLKKRGGLCHPLSASLPERLLVKKARVSKLHPNPDDEFCNPAIGPNYGIVSNYQNKFLLERKGNEKLVDEPLIVQKISTGGYMLLNGHHRWMAANKIGKKRVDIQIVNPTLDADIISAINQSQKDLCVSFDLDEVLLSRDAVSFPRKLLIKQDLRRNVGLLVNELQKHGCDVWVYSGSFLSQRYVDLLFALQHARITGLINGLQKKKTSTDVRKAFDKQYRMRIHVDNESLLCVNTQTKVFHTVNLPHQGDWANEAFDAILKLTKDPQTEN